MMRGEGTLRERLEQTAAEFADLDAECFPPGLRGSFESWATTWFQADSIDDFGWDTLLKDDLEESEIEMAVRELTDEMWAKVDTDYQIHNPPQSNPHYDWE